MFQSLFSFGGFFSTEQDATCQGLRCYRPVRVCPAWYNEMRKWGEHYEEQKIGAQDAGLYRGHGDGRETDSWSRNHRPECGWCLYQDRRRIPERNDAAAVHRSCRACSAGSTVPSRDGDVVEAWGQQASQRHTLYWGGRQEAAALKSHAVHAVSWRQRIRLRHRTGRQIHDNVKGQSKDCPLQFCSVSRIPCPLVVYRRNAVKCKKRPIPAGIYWQDATLMQFRHTFRYQQGHISGQFNKGKNPDKRLRWDIKVYHGR